MMKRLLRKLFFWDAPAQGAFFALTLLAILPRFILTVGYGVMLPLYLLGGQMQRIVLIGESFGGLVVLIGLALLYALVLFGHVFPKQRLGKVHAIATCLCAALMLGHWGLAPSEYEDLWWIFPVLLIVFSIVYQGYPSVKIHDWLFAVVPLIIGGAALFRTLKVIVQILSASMLVDFQFVQPGSADHSEWLMWSLTIVSILLLALSYLLWGRIIAKIGGVSFRSLFGRGVVTLWAVFAILYLTSTALAVYAIRDYSNAKEELDAFWKMPVNAQTIQERYKASGRIDQAFWKELTSLTVEFSELNKQYDGIDAIDGTPNAVLPPDVYEQWRKAFEESPELLRGEAMLNEPPPLPERSFGFGFDLVDSNLNKLSKCRVFSRLELWRVRLALEAKDIRSAQKALQRIDNVSAALQYDYNMVSVLVLIAIEQMRPSALSKIIGSGLADEQWLREQDALLQEKERRIPAVHQRMIQGEAAHILSIMDTYLKHTSRSLFLTIPESWYFLEREGAALARSYCISDLADFPENPAGIFAAMLTRPCRLVGTMNLPSLTATLRISRGMIAAELARQKNGRYPDAMDDLLTDPFSGKPLKYAIAKVEISEERFQLNEDPTRVDITPELQKQLGIADEQLAVYFRPRKYVFKTEHRTVDAVQIWSVGPNGIDDNGIRFPGNEALGDKPKDDIRYVIQIQ